MKSTGVTAHIAARKIRNAASVDAFWVLWAGLRRATILRMKVLATAAALLFAVVVSTTATAATAKKWYWSESRADAVVVANVRIPFCRVYPGDNECPVGSMKNVAIRLDSADCSGASEYRSSFTYNRFTCEVVTYNNGANARIAVYVTGRSTFRWRVILKFRGRHRGQHGANRMRHT